jgi:hypothetical protein
MDQELVQYLDERFGRIEQRLDGHDQRFLSLEQRFEQRFEEVKRHTGVLVEGLRQEVHLVAEGLIMHVEVRHREDREYFDRKFEDTHALIRSSYDHLQQQQDQLRQSQDQIHQRVENLERN